MNRVTRLLLVMLVAPMLVAPLLAAPARTAAAPGTRASGPSLADHVLVWDKFKARREGIHLWTARGDGSHARRVYATDHGFTMALVLDRAATRVAFAPCCRKDLPQLVVVPLDGGKAINPLRHHREIYAVGGIAWSPDGRLLAFEGDIVGADGNPDPWLWTVRPNGSHLRRVVRTPWPSPEQPIINDALAWTRDGILYSDGTDLKIARDGHSRVLLRRTYSVRPSGDGRHIVTLRSSRDGHVAYWLARSDGTHRRQILKLPGTPGHRLRDLVPDHDARLVLAARESTYPDEPTDEYWRTDEPPTTATVLELLDGNYPFTWD